MFKSVIVLTALVAAGSAQAATVLFSDGFEADTPQLSETSALTNWTVSGNVDVVATGTFAVTCANGICIDLDGTPGPGRITSNPIAFVAGREVVISYDLSGNQRLSSSDAFVFEVSFGLPIDIAGASWSQPGGDIGSMGPAINFSGQAFFPVIPRNDPWTTFTYRFRPTTSGVLTLQFGTSSADNFGPLVDNVLVTQAAIPEPATWAMLITGFGLVGFAARRRRPVTATA
jgi:hypothetical protein